MSENPRTIPALLHDVTTRWPGRDLLHYCSAGADSRSYTTEQLDDAVRRTITLLETRGIRAGDSVGLMSDASPEWVIIDLAVMSMGAVLVPMFPNMSDDSIAFQVRDADMRLVFYAEEEHARLLEKCVSHACPLMTLEDRQVAPESGWLAAIAEAVPAEGFGEKVRPGDLATIVYTSGSTGQPKGVALSHQALCTQARNAAVNFPLDQDGDCAVSCLPLAHIFERMVFYGYLAQGAPVHFVDDIKRVGEVLREIRPAIITLVPRLVEKVYARLVAGVREGPAVTRLLGRIACHHAEQDDPHEPHDVVWRLSNRLVYSRFRNALGGRLRMAVVGGAAMDVGIIRFMANVGIPLYQGYGMTETCAAATANTPQANRDGTVGKAFPGVSIRIAGDQEIQIKGDSVMIGYHHNPEATAETLDPEGWLSTGDLGSLDEDGYLTITGRKKELIKTSNGKYVHPAGIEQALVRNGLIDMAMVIGENRRFVACLLFPDMDVLHRTKAAYGLQDLSDEDALAHDTVRTAIDTVLAKVNESLNHWEQVREYRLLPVNLSVESGELTPTMKIRRQVVMERFADVIEAMYNDGMSDKAT